MIYMNPSPYRLTAAPKFAGMIEHDCALCEYETLKHPVFLVGPAGVIAAGSGCAAVALYGRKDAGTVRLIKTEAARLAHLAAVAAEMAAERRNRYTVAAAQFADRDARAGDNPPELASARAAYWSTVRGAWDGEHRVTFPAFMAAVAESGELPD